jgi:hypothetical protein
MAITDPKLIKKEKLSLLHGEKRTDTKAKRRKMNKSWISRSKTNKFLLLLKEDNT